MSGSNTGAIANIYGRGAGNVTYLLGASHQIYFDLSGNLYSGAYGNCVAGVKIIDLISSGRTSN